MWTVVYIAPHMKEAERIKVMLSVEGFLVKLKSVGLSQVNENGPVEVLVPESEAEEATEILAVCKLSRRQGYISNPG